jgi:hypothetical protein
MSRLLAEHREARDEARKLLDDFRSGRIRSEQPKQDEAWVVRLRNEISMWNAVIAADEALRNAQRL